MHVGWISRTRAQTTFLHNVAMRLAYSTTRGSLMPARQKKRLYWLWEYRGRGRTKPNSPLLPSPLVRSGRPDQLGQSLPTALDTTGTLAANLCCVSGLEAPCSVGLDCANDRDLRFFNAKRNRVWLLPLMRQLCCWSSPLSLLPRRIRGIFLTAPEPSIEDYFLYSNVLR